MVVEFSMFPLDKGESLGRYVARVVDIVDKSKLPHHTCAMGTTVEGNWDEIFRLIKRCHNALRKDCHRIYTKITVDDRKGAKNRMKGKVQSLKKILKREIM